jgi:hypothetical protein
MLAAIKFDHQSRRPAGKIGDVRSYRTLADELRAFEATASEVVPEPILGARSSPSQVACEGRQTLLCQRRAPSPQPSPRRGEGVFGRHALIPFESDQTVNA